MSSFRQLAFFYIARSLRFFYVIHFIVCVMWHVFFLICYHNVYFIHTYGFLITFLFMLIYLSQSVSDYVASQLNDLCVRFMFSFYFSTIYHEYGVTNVFFLYICFRVFFDIVSINEMYMVVPLWNSWLSARWFSLVTAALKMLLNSYLIYSVPNFLPCRFLFFSFFQKLPHRDVCIRAHINKIYIEKKDDCLTML